MSFKSWNKGWLCCTSLLAAQVDENMATTEDVSSEFLAEDRSQVLVDISIAFIVLTTVVLAARFYARRFQGLGGFHADDAFVLAAYVVNLGMCAVGIGESNSLQARSFFRSFVSHLVSLT